MSDETRVEIGGIGFLFRHKGLRIEEAKDKKPDIAEFICPGKIDLTVDVEVGELPEYPKDNMLFDAGENWRLYQDDARYIIELYKSDGETAVAENWPGNIPFPLKTKDAPETVSRVCFMQKDRPGVVVYIHPNADNGYSAGHERDDKAWSLEQLMRILGQVLTISVLHRYQGIIIHSSGLVLKGEGIIFCGISGAGKTTTARLWERAGKATVLSDDRVIVRRENGGYFIYGTPWPGEGRMISRRKAPLKKIFFLRKALKNEFTPVNKTESFRQIMTQCFPAIWDRASVEFSLKFCGELVRDIPALSFGFLPDETAVDFVLNSAKESY